MKDKETKDDTYFLGNDQTNPRHRKSLYGKVACIVIIMMLVGAAIGAYLSYRSAGSVQRGHQLETIVVLPQGGQMPKFDGDKDFSEFRKYPVSPRGRGQTSKSRSQFHGQDRRHFRELQGRCGT